MQKKHKTPHKSVIMFLFILLTALTTMNCGSLGETGTGGDPVDNPPVLSSGLPSGALASGTVQTVMSVATDEVATCKYSEVAGTPYSSMVDTFFATGGTSHFTIMSGLQDGGSYKYYIKCEDAQRNADEDDYAISFTVGVAGAGGGGTDGSGDGGTDGSGGGGTDGSGGGGSGSDTTPPYRSSGSPVGALASGTVQTVMSVATDEVATCKYTNIAGTAYSSMANTFSTAGGTAHSTTLSGLQDGHSYKYYIKCKDAEGNTNTDDYSVSFSVIDPSGGDAYYVSPTGSDSNSGSINAPWQNIQTAFDRTGPGDTVILRGGTYGGSGGEFWIHGANGHGGGPGSFWTLEAYPGEEVILKTRILVDASYVRIQGIHFICSLASPTYIAVVGNWSGFGDHIEILDNLFTGDYTNQPAGAIACNCSNSLVEGNTVNMDIGQPGTKPHGIYIMAGANFLNENTVVRNNTILSTIGYGIHVYDERKSDSDPTHVLRNITVEGNYVTGSQLRSGIIAVPGPNARVENVIIRNNVVVNNPQWGITGGDVKGLQIYNNTISGNPDGGIGEAFNPSNVEIHHNIIADGTWSISVDNTAGGVSVHDNFYSPTPKLQNVTDATAKSGDPMFVNPAGGDFHLQTGSPATGYGAF